MATPRPCPVVGQGWNQKGGEPPMAKHDRRKTCGQPPSSQPVTIQVPLPVLGVINGVRESFHGLCIATGLQALAARGESRGPAWSWRDRTRTLKTHGNGQETGGATGVAAVVDDSGFADQRGASFLRAPEPGPGGGGFRRLRRRAVRGVLRDADGPAESASWAVFPDAVDRLLRGAVFGARDCVAGGRFTEPAVVPGPGCDRGLRGLRITRRCRGRVG